MHFGVQQGGGVHGRICFPMSKRQPELFPEPKKRFKPPSLVAVLIRCQEIGLPEEEGRLFFFHHETRGWKLKGGISMVSWPAALETWKINWKKWSGDSHAPNNGKLNGSMVIVKQRELERLEKQIDMLDRSHDKFEKEKLPELRSKRLQIRKELGLE